MDFLSSDRLKLVSATSPFEVPYGDLRENWEKIGRRKRGKGNKEEEGRGDSRESEKESVRERRRESGRERKRDRDRDRDKDRYRNRDRRRDRGKEKYRDERRRDSGRKEKRERGAGRVKESQNTDAGSKPAKAESEEGEMGFFSDSGGETKGKIRKEQSGPGIDTKAEKGPESQGTETAEQKNQKTQDLVRAQTENPNIENKTQRIEINRPEKENELIDKNMAIEEESDDNSNLFESSQSASPDRSRIEKGKVGKDNFMRMFNRNSSEEGIQMKKIQLESPKHRKKNTDHLPKVKPKKVKREISKIEETKNDDLRESKMIIKEPKFGAVDTQKIRENVVKKETKIDFTAITENPQIKKIKSDIKIKSYESEKKIQEELKIEKDRETSKDRELDDLMGKIMENQASGTPPLNPGTPPYQPGTPPYQPGTPPHIEEHALKKVPKPESQPKSKSQRPDLDLKTSALGKRNQPEPIENSKDIKSKSTKHKDEFFLGMEEYHNYRTNRSSQENQNQNTHKNIKAAKIERIIENNITNSAFEKKILNAKISQSGNRKSESSERSSLSRRQKKKKKKRRREEILKQHKRESQASTNRGSQWVPNKKESGSQSLKVASGSDQGPDATKIKIYRQITPVTRNNENSNTIREQPKINERKQENEVRAKEYQIDSNLKLENDNIKENKSGNLVDNNFNNNTKEQDSDLEDEKDSLLNDMSEGEVAMPSPEPKTQNHNQNQNLIPKIPKNKPVPTTNLQPQIKNETNTKSSKNLANTTEISDLQELSQSSSLRVTAYLSSKTELPTDHKPTTSKYDPFNPVRNDSPLYTVERSNKSLKRASKKARTKSRANDDASNQADLKEVSREKRGKKSKSKSRSRSRSRSGQDKRGKKRRRKRDMFEEMGIKERRQKERRRKKKKKRGKEGKMDFDGILNRFDKKQKKSRKIRKHKKHEL